VALGALVMAASSASAESNGAKEKKKHHHVIAEPKVDRSAEMEREMSELRQQVEALKAWKDAQEASASQAQMQLAQVKQQLADAQAQADAAKARLEAQDASIKTVKKEVRQVAAGAAPDTDKIYFHIHQEPKMDKQTGKPVLDPVTGEPETVQKAGLSVQFGGFVAAESVFRSRGEAADMASSFSGIPLPNVVAGRTNETRLSARQSRITMLAQGDVPNTGLHLAGYGEVDFLGAAQTANSNETNSYTPRIRVLYSTIDLDRDFGGVQLLAGQNWSLATMNTKGITPRNELPPPSIDAQYVPGFVFARQPQVRVTANIDHTFWFAASLENPQTTYYTSGKYLSGVSVVNTEAAGSGFNSANSLSLNKYPDLIAKAAYDHDVSGHSVHVEAFGILRDFYARVNTAGVAGNQDTTGGGIGGGAVIALLPKLFDVQASTLFGRGIGRYGASQLPDASFGVDGRLHPIREWDLLAGGTLHLGKSIDVYALGGEEREFNQDYASGTTYNGVGNPFYDNTGCETEGASNCVGNTHYVLQYTGGFWDRPYVGKFGRIQWGIQYSYTERHLFAGYGTAGAAGNPSPVARDNMILTSIRYYPF
jgi:hypothetical protein